MQRTLRRSVVLTLSLALCATVTWAQNAEITASHVSGAVHMLEGQGGNIGVSAGEDGILIVDDQFAHMVPKIREALAGISEGDLAFVLNTHWHGDHTGGNAAFGDEATIVAHHNVRIRLAKGATGGRREVPPAPKEALPVVTYDDGLSIHFNGEEIKVGHLPKGHTDGDSYIYFSDANVVHLGDHYFKNRFPFVDLSSGGNALGLRDNIASVLDWLPADAKVIPGHGSLSNVEELKTYHQMLVETIDSVKAKKAAGTSLDDIKAAGFGKYDSWGEGFINAPSFAEFIYRSLD